MPCVDMKELNDLLCEEEDIKVPSKRKRPHAAVRYATRKNRSKNKVDHDLETEEVTFETVELTETVVQETTEELNEVADVTATETTTEQIEDTAMNNTAEQIKEEATNQQVNNDDLVIITPTANHYEGMEIKDIEKIVTLVIGVKYGKITQEEAIASGDKVVPGAMAKILADELDLSAINTRNVFNDESKASLIDELRYIGKSLVSVVIPSYAPYEKLSFEHYSVIVNDDAPMAVRIGYAKGLMHYIAGKLGLKTQMSEDYSALSLTIQLRHTNVVFRATTDDNGKVTFSVDGLNNKHVRLVDTVKSDDLTIKQFARLITGVAAVRF